MLCFWALEFVICHLFCCCWGYNYVYTDRYFQSFLYKVRLIIMFWQCTCIFLFKCWFLFFPYRDMRWFLFLKIKFLFKKICVCHYLTHPGFEKEFFYFENVFFFILKNSLEHLAFVFIVISERRCIKVVVFMAGRKYVTQSSGEIH